MIDANSLVSVPESRPFTVVANADTARRQWRVSLMLVVGLAFAIGGSLVTIGVHPARGSSAATAEFVIVRPAPHPTGS